MTPLDVILDSCGLRHLEPLLAPAPINKHLVDFKVGPILSTGDRPSRLYLSWDGERAAWTRRIRSRFPSPIVDAFLSEVPSACRRMVDTDGQRAELYLDDLQEHGYPEMCRVLSWPELTRSRLVETTHCPASLRRLLEPVLQLGGKLALRSPGTRVVWISEARWRKRAGEAAAALRDVLPPAFPTLAERLKTIGLRPYIDAIDAYNGAMDITVGLLPLESAEAT